VALDVRVMSDNRGIWNQKAGFGILKSQHEELPEGSYVPSIRARALSDCCRYFRARVQRSRDPDQPVLTGDG